MHQLRRDCGPGDPRESSLEKIIFAVWVISPFKGMETVRLSSEQWRPIQEMLADLNCPNGFSSKVKVCGEESRENALCTEGDCRFEFNPELAEKWD